MHHTLHPDFSAKYQLLEELGSGGFGFVMAAVDRQGTQVAVKFIFKDKVPSHAWVRTNDEIIPMEIYVLKHVNHPSVIQFLDCYQDDRFCYLVMELYGTPWGPSPGLSSSISEDSFNSDDEDYLSSPRRSSCDLFECIERHSNFDELRAKMVFEQIVECVAHLDSLGICHRDIKDENIVIDDQYKVKLIDFGSSVILPRHYGQPNKTYLFEKFYGTLSFASPEILMGKLYRAEPAEIWSLGVLLYTILFGEVPFANPRATVAGQLLLPKINVSDQCLHLISCLLDPNPDSRPTIHQILMHPWLRDA